MLERIQHRFTRMLPGATAVCTLRRKTGQVEPLDSGRAKTPCSPHGLEVFKMLRGFSIVPLTYFTLDTRDRIEQEDIRSS